MDAELKARAAAEADSPGRGMTREQRKVVLGASLGTIFEFYDFVLFGSMSTVIAAKFFAPLSPSLALIFALLAFAVAYAVRPLGAFVFGRIGDRVGRKVTFLVTVAGMGTATFLVGLLPSYATWGLAAPVLLMVLRVVQGISIGGEFGGAASYVAEHAPPGRLGYYTSWIQICASAGVVVSLLVILGIRAAVGDAAFADWGWRLPFLLSALLLAVSMWIRARLNESPVFQRMKAAGKTTRTPVRDLYGSWSNVRKQLAVLFGPLAAAQVLGVLALIYLMVFLVQTLRVDPQTVNWITCTAILAALPIFPIAGWLSDRIGRKPVVVTACLLAGVSIFPAVRLLTHYANPAYEQSLASAPITVAADGADCSFIFNPTGTARFLSSCDILKSTLSREGVNYRSESATAGAAATVRIGSTSVESFDGRGLAGPDLKTRTDALAAQIRNAVRAAGYPARADMGAFNGGMVWLVIFYITVLFAMAQSAVAAILVELFPASIRYTAVSVPYHVSSILAGFLVPIGFALSVAAGDIYFGLWYPVFWALLGGLVYLLFLPETRGQAIENWF